MMASTCQSEWTLCQIPWGRWRLLISSWCSFLNSTRKSSIILFDQLVIDVVELLVLLGDVDAVGGVLLDTKLDALAKLLVELLVIVLLPCNVGKEALPPRPLCLLTGWKEKMNLQKVWDLTSCHQHTHRAYIAGQQVIIKMQCCKTIDMFVKLPIRN